MRGSWTNASSMAMTLPLSCRITLMTLSHVKRKVPSIPHTSMAEVSMRVSLNGIFSGNLSRCIATSKQSPKSMCTTWDGGRKVQFSRPQDSVSSVEIFFCGRRIED
jgi:hypothetical protein